ALVRRPIGATFKLTLKRSGKTLNVEATTTKSPTAPHGPMLGVSITQVLANQFPSKLPIDMKIDAGDIGGPSAGLMFTLGLLQRLSPTDLTKGYQIAGTGTISLDGSVGAIGGVKQKIIGAQWAHANYFFVPVDGGNYDDAKKVVGKSMTLVPVHNLNDALKFLNELKPKQ
ncbi:MAG: S16 family serine protease, partial [Chloroflexota bacterium]